MRIETRLIHAGELRPRRDGAVNVPIYQSVMFEYGGESSYHDLRYARLSNTPNHDALHAKLAALEGAEAALVTGSGMAAISTTLLSLLKSGDHLLVQGCLYGGTHDLLAKDLPALGISHDVVDIEAPATWATKLRSTTRLIYVESIANPLMLVPPFDEVTRFAKAHGLVSVIDNTFTSPVLFRPLELGFDLSLHSATKYLNGHSDIVAGAVMGSAELVTRVKHKLDHLGGTLDPHACFLLHRGLKTLALRVRHQSATALAVAEYLSSHPKIARVAYPGLASHPQHARAAKAFDGGAGGVLSFELRGGLEEAKRLLSRVELPLSAPSLGGVESLITLPSTTSHAGMEAEERRRIGISDGLVRLSVGVEAVEDLIDDLRRALD